jgi:hypothetical protein
MVREIYIEKHLAFDAEGDDRKVIDGGAKIGFSDPVH